MTAYPRAKTEAVHRFGSFDPDTPRLRTAFVAGAQWERMRTRTAAELDAVVDVLLDLGVEVEFGKGSETWGRDKARAILDAAREAS